MTAKYSGKIVWKGTSAQPDATKFSGMIGHDIENNIYYFSNGTTWLPSANWSDSTGTALVRQDGSSVAYAPQASLLCAAIGDSRYSQALQDQSTATPQLRVNYSTQGALFWLGFLTYQTARIPYNYIAAQSGATTAQIAAQVSSVIALSPRPRVCFIMGGTNSLSATPTYAQVQASLADLTGAAVALRAAGIEPVIETDAPRTVASWTSNQRLLAIALNRALREWCMENGVRCADAEYVQIASGGDPVSSYKVADGIHDSATGALVRAIALKNAVDDLLPLGYGTQISHPLDAFDATYNPGGNLLANGLFTGTGGANSGSGASGTVSDSWTNQSVSGTQTCVASKENPRADGRMGNALVQTITATTASVTRLAQTGNISTSGKVVAGDVVYAEVDVEISSLSGTLEYAHLYAFDFDGSNNGSVSIGGKNTFAATLSPMPALPLAKNTAGNWLSVLSGRLRTAPIVIGQGITSTTLIYRLEASLAASSSVVLKWGQASLRKVA